MRHKGVLRFPSPTPSVTVTNHRSTSTPDDRNLTVSTEGIEGFETLIPVS